LANFVQFKRLLMFCLEDWGAGPPAPPLGYAIGYSDVYISLSRKCHKLAWANDTAAHYAAIHSWCPVHQRLRPIIEPAMQPTDIPPSKSTTLDSHSVAGLAEGRRLSWRAKYEKSSNSILKQWL